MEMGKNRNKKAHPIELRPAVDQIVMTGRFAYMLGDSEGKALWPSPLYTDNTVVTSGRSWVLKHIMSSQSSNVSMQLISALALGTGTAAPTTADTLMGTEILRKTNITETDNSGSSAPNCVWAASFATNEGNHASLSEFGIFNTSAANAQTLLARATTAAFSKTTSNTLTVSYQVSN